jgi:hypothetical protein
MKDPKLLVNEGATDFERRWLSSARAEELPPEVVGRIERALGLGTGAAAAAAAAAAATAAPPAKAATAAAAGSLAALRIAGLSALGVGGTVGLVLLLAHPSPPTPTADRPPPARSSAAPGAPAIGASPAMVTPPAATAEKPTAAAGGALRDEIALIDGARAALAGGSTAQALALLERYRAHHPRGMLLPEALALHIEAIDRSGEHARARALARAFLAEYPQSPLAQRLAHLGAPEQR